MGAISSDSEFESYLEETRRGVNQSISDFISGISNMEIYPFLKYTLMSDGKRLRPILAITSASVFGADRAKVINLSMAFEMLHTATLVHDDIIDGDKMRRNIPSVNGQWGHEIAILVGDALISLGINLSSEYGPDIIKAVAEYGISLCNGEYLDITSRLSMISEEQYLRTIKLKSAALFKAVARCGALAAGASPAHIDMISEYAENFGIAYQIYDDIIDTMAPNGEISKDMKEGRVTLPLVHLYNNIDIKGKEEVELELMEISRKPDSKTSLYYATQIVDQITRNNSLSYCRALASGYVAKGIEAISGLPDNKYRSYLERMISYIDTGKILPL